MPFTKSLCPQCGKIAQSEREFSIGGKTVHRLKCSHLMFSNQLENKSPESIISLDNKKPYAFQCEGIRFSERANARVLISDEMGLGKTIQALGVIALHPELTPFIAIVKSSLRAQWAHETMRWLGEEHITQVINSANDFFLPGMTGYIISYDLLRRFLGVKKSSIGPLHEGKDTFYDEVEIEIKPKETKNRLIENIERLGIKTIILDECQQIKNTDSQRTVHVRAICKHVDHIIALSGTPIKNNAAEYFPILNILKPEIFPNYSKFVMNDCDSYFTGYGHKTGGIKDPERFH